jgi:small GTP-binding protein
MEENQPDYIFKIIIVGSSGVGKSALLLRCTDSHFYENSCSTIGVDYRLKTLEVLVNQIPKIVKLQIWDTAGQERFRSLTLNYLRGSHAVIMVFSLDDVESFKSIDYWIELVKSHGNFLNHGFFLIGNKCDIEKYQITEEMIHKLCEKYAEISYIQASAKTGENVSDLFTKLAFDLANKQAKLLADENTKKRLILERKKEEEGEVKEGRKCCGGTQ